jgi:TolB protein
VQSTGPRRILGSTLLLVAIALSVPVFTSTGAFAATECPARGSRVVFARSLDSFGGNWGIAAVTAPEWDVTWVLAPPKAGRSIYNFRPSVSPADGTILWDTNQGGRQRIRVMACDGTGAKDWSARSGPKDSMGAAFSPDGTQVAFVARMPGNTSKTQPKFGLYVAPFAQPGQARLVTKKVAAGGMHPAWSPDGTKLAFSAGASIPHIAVVNLDGTGYTELTKSKNGDGEPAWSPDGAQIAYNSSAEGDDVWIMNADGTGARKLATGEVSAYQPAFSPGGEWVAYVKNSIGHSELWLINPDGSGDHALTTTTGKEANEAPAW